MEREAERGREREREREREERDVLGEAASELDGTADLGQLGEAVHLGEGRVVGDQETTADGRQLGHRDAGQLGVADERDVTAGRRRQVRGREVGEEVGVEAHGPVDRGQRGGVERRHVGDGHVGDPDQVGEADLEVQAVGVDVEVVGQVAQGRRVRHQALVVVDVHGVDRRHVEAVERAQEGVGDDDALGRLDALGAEVERVEEVERLEADAAAARQAGEAQVGQGRQVLQDEVARYGADGAALEVGQELVVVDREVALDGREAREVERRVRAGAHGHVTLEGPACRQLGDVGLRVDGEGILGAGIALGCRGAGGGDIPSASASRQKADPPAAVARRGGRDETKRSTYLRRARLLLREQELESSQTS